MVCSQGRGVRLPLLLLNPFPQCPTHSKLCQRQAPLIEYRQCAPDLPATWPKVLLLPFVGMKRSRPREAGFIHSSIHALTQRLTGEDSRDNKTDIVFTVVAFPG